MKKIMAVMLSLLACTVLLAGCNTSSESNEEQSLKVYSFSGDKDLEAAYIPSASVRLSPPDTTIQIVETEELVSYLNEVVIYNKDNSYTEYAGQAVIFTLSLADGSQVEIIAYNPFIIIDGIGYKCKYEPCEALNHYANELMTREP